MRYNDSKVWDRLYSDYEEAERLGHKVLGVFLQGSQNYNLDYSNSDIDTKCVVLPSFEDICLVKKMVSTTHVLETNEHLDLKDIRDMMHQFKKQNINFLEILFTEHFVLNPKYYDLWMPLVEHREEIAHYNTVKNVTATSGMSKEKLKALCLDRPSQHDEIVQYGWAKKQLHHCIRLREFIERYINGEPFADCLISKDTGYLVDIKAFGHKFYTLDEAVSLATKMDTETYALKEEYIKTHEEVINKKAEQLMLDTTVNILKKTLREDILK